MYERRSFARAESLDLAVSSHRATLARALAAIAAIAAAVAGVIWGTHVAGGPDSYCYLSQAELFASVQVAHTERLASIAPWPHGAEAFVPVGHVPAARQAGASVPMCSPGYPIAMAAARLAGGRRAMFAIVPLCGAAAVWLTFVLGGRVAGTGAPARSRRCCSRPVHPSSTRLFSR